MRILGLDLGISSVGWALIETDNNSNPSRILGMGSRILPLAEPEINNFNKGQGETPCKVRTAQRTARKGNFRYKMRRKLLSDYLSSLGMIPDSKQMTSMKALDLWGLRAKAAMSGEQIGLQELGRVLLHMNQKRGYRHSRVGGEGKEETAYVQEVNNRFKEIKEKGLTVGQEFYARLLRSVTKSPDGSLLVCARLKEEVFPRQAYVEEFNRIMEAQKEFYPEILTEKTIENLRDAIFLQRPLKSCKHLVSICEFSAREYTSADGRKVIGGPRVAPRSSPLTQICRLYEAVNNIRLTNLRNKGRNKNCLPSLFEERPIPRDARLLMENYELTGEEKRLIVDFLNENEKLNVNELFKILGLKKSDGFVVDKAVLKGIGGNKTLIELKRALEGWPEAEKLLRFNLMIVDSNKVNSSTGEVIRIIDKGVFQQPLYRLWHLVYSISDPEELRHALIKDFGINDEEIIQRLLHLNFTSSGYSNKSSSFMRRLLPYLIKGFGYSEACDMVGINHSGSMTKEENETRELSPRLTPLVKNSLRQPLVEKVLNQMINVVNAIIERYGPIDEVRVEMARSLKQSASEREKASKEIASREKENRRIGELISEYGVAANRKRIQKYRMWEETSHTCMYCGRHIGLSEWLSGHDAEVEHIIPRSIFFDDSFSNKTCACRECNNKKDNATGYDFMARQGKVALESYIARVEELCEKKSISKTKRNRLLTSAEEIPTDFLERDMRLTQYIARKACDILRESIRDVYASSGTVTAFFRHVWGYDQIIERLNIPRYRLAGLVSEQEYENKGQHHTREVITDWNKRKDHRHHAVDALTIALTRQGYIQRLSTLNASRDGMYNELKRSGAFSNGDSLLLNWAETRPHFSTAQVEEEVGRIAVSLKGGKKFSTPGLRKFRRNGKTIVVQRHLNIPRGPLHKESIYGQIMLPDGIKKLKYCFENPELVIDPEIRQKINLCIEMAGGDRQKAWKTIGRKNPFLHPHTGIDVKETECRNKEYVIRKKVDQLEPKKIADVVDGGIRRLLEERAREYPDIKKFQASFAEHPLRLNPAQAPIRAVRVRTGLKESSMAGARKDAQGHIIGYAATGSNHHVGYYEDAGGKAVPFAVSMWTAMQRKNAGIPVIIEDPKLAADLMMQLADESLREEIASALPSPDWKFLIKFQINDMFIMGLSDEEIEEARRTNNLHLLTNHLYRVQKGSEGYLVFRLHTDSTAELNQQTTEIKTSLLIASYGKLQSFNPRRVHIDLTGQITFAE